MRPKDVVKKETRQLIAQAMVDDQMAHGWYETASNPRIPDAEVMAMVMRQLGDVSNVLREPEKLTVEVTNLAALVVSWLQNCTNPQGKGSWS